MNASVNVPEHPPRQRSFGRQALARRAQSPGSAPAAAPLFADGALLDAEKLRVYQVAVAFQPLAARLVGSAGRQC